MSLLITVAFVLSGCAQKNTNTETKNESKKETKTEEKKQEKEKEGGVADVCNYFPKELVEKAIGKPIVKTEVPIIGSENCYYYTQYIEDYEKSYSGKKKPGGPHVVAVYDFDDFAKDRVTNEKHGTTYETDASIGMDNFVMRNNIKKIWQTALVLGNDKYLRIKFVDDAVTGEDLVKIAKEFAGKIKDGK